MNAGLAVGGPQDGATLLSGATTIPIYITNADLSMSLDGNDFTLIGNYIFDGAAWNWSPA